jgi:hypothetical protein
MIQRYRREIQKKLNWGMQERYIEMRDTGRTKVVTEKLGGDTGAPGWGIQERHREVYRNYREIQGKFRKITE